MNKFVSIETTLQLVVVEFIDLYISLGQNGFETSIAIIFNEL